MAVKMTAAKAVMAAVDVKDDAPAVAAGPGFVFFKLPSPDDT